MVDDIKPIISMIAAMGENHAIGKNGKIPWDIPEDMAYLRRVTNGKPLIMGRATYESVCKYRKIDPKTNAAMPNRFNVMISRDGTYFGDHIPEGAAIATSPQEGLTIAYEYAMHQNIPEIFVFGGAEIYKALLPHTERLYLTEVEQTFQGDAFFPEFNRDNWKRIKHDQRNGFAFNIYDRIKPL
jgi:dihydrofolate reductase